jgi:hypothetical protein
MTVKSLQSAAPIVLLGIALVALLTHPAPGPNRDLLNIIIGGLLGHLQRSNHEAAVSIDPPATVTVEEGK